jgi:hypothetical protein
LGGFGFGSMDDPRSAGVVFENMAREFIVPRLLILWDVHMKKYSKGSGTVSRQLIVSLMYSLPRGTHYVSSYVANHQLSSSSGMKQGLTCKSLVLEMVALQTSQIAQVSFFS